MAAFDFDGTITQRDTLGGFLVHAAGGRALGGAFRRNLRDATVGLRDDAARDRGKERIVGQVLAGLTEQRLRALGRSYAALLATRFRPATIDRIEWHRSEGHEIVIVSASLVYYLEPVADALGLDGVLGVELAFDDQGVATGALTHANLRGEQKAIRLREWLDATAPADDGRALELWAYGNSSGDDQLLAMADHPQWVGRRAERNR